MSLSYFIRISRFFLLISKISSFYKIFCIILLSQKNQWLARKSPIKKSLWTANSFVKNTLLMHANSEMSQFMLVDAIMRTVKVIKLSLTVPLSYTILASQSYSFSFLLQFVELKASKNSFIIQFNLSWSPSVHIIKTKFKQTGSRRRRRSPRHICLPFSVIWIGSLAAFFSICTLRRECLMLVSQSFLIPYYVYLFILFSFYILFHYELKMSTWRTKVCTLRMMLLLLASQWQNGKLSKNVLKQFCVSCGKSLIVCASGYVWPKCVSF